MNECIPQDALVENQKSFTIEVSEQMAKAIQAALNEQAEDMGTPFDEYMLAKDFIEDFLVDEAVDFVFQLEPYNR